ncbi:multicopper oxidase family protein [Streptomyces rhizosphaerihabitans]|uniref:multicopper oxidase family protein n=1 Tax=Streptomyces rhizosphaerihabitans TaxID=1266770 RepID=UPI0021BF9A6F|nr:multicopper oxidase family protein [Streptomyces rhizosphaerihabitans]MCT9004708.1 multicopper oxidase family protein [Streptomyces rhizosphaerihabitans]
MNSINRRSVLAGLGAAGTGLLAAYGNDASNSPSLLSPSGSQVAHAEKKRSGTGRVQSLNVTSAPATLDLGGGVLAKSWAFSGQVPGKEIRISAGDTLAAELSNQLPNATTTSIHWHGISLPGDMDGVPPVTQAPVRAGSSFTYRFITNTPGTYFFHPHVGVQVDRGLYAPLIVEDPKEPLSYDDEWVVVLDDWLDGVTGTPDDVFAELSHRSPGMDMKSTGSKGPTSSPPPSPSASSGDGTSTRFRLSGASSPLLGSDAGDVNYPYHLVNGRVPTDPAVYTGKSGKRVRLRIINAGAETAYRVALGGHRMTITHTDGFPVEHQEVDALLIAMGERYDVLVTLQDGVFPLVAVAEGKDVAGMAVVRTGSGRTPEPTVRPAELDGRMVTAAQLRASDDVRLESKDPDQVIRVELTGSMRAYDWAINGKQFDMADPTANQLLVQEGQRVQLDFVNATKMWHPMHLHGHTYQLDSTGPRKDTTIVLPRSKVSVVFDADNPGQWMLHCHNAYHSEAGMMVLLAYGA